MMNNNDSFEKIARKISEFDRCFITTHRNPEGDAIGSSLALLIALEQMGKTVRFSLDDGVPHPLQFLPAATKAASGLVPDNDELVIVLDCPNLERISSSFRTMARRTAVINIDHHLDNSNFGELNYVDSAACATGELVYFLIKVMTDHIDRDTATLLYTAILTDTGSFRFANTNENAFMISKELLRCGLDPHSIAQLIYESYTLSKMRLLGHALATLEISDDQRVGWITISRDTLTRYGAKDSEMEGLVNYPRHIDGVAVSILFHEMTTSSIKVSFRSKGAANVAEFAKRWGGGGHKNAAACIQQGSMAEVKNRILSELLPAMQLTGLEDEKNTQ